MLLIQIHPGRAHPGQATHIQHLLPQLVVHQATHTAAEAVRPGLPVAEVIRQEAVVVHLQVVAVAVVAVLQVVEEDK